MTPKETAIKIIKDCEYIQELDYAFKNSNWRYDALKQVNLVMQQLDDLSWINNIDLQIFWRKVAIEILHYDLP